MISSLCAHRAPHFASLVHDGMVLPHDRGNASYVGKQKPHWHNGATSRLWLQPW